MLVLPSSGGVEGGEGVEGTLRESKATRSWATAVQISRSEALGEATFSRSEEQ
jgi:hypothetical protein